LIGRRNNSRRARNGQLVVLQSLRVVRSTTNPYLIMLVRGLAAMDGLAVKYFSYRTALLGRYDVFHAHWPEIFLDGSTVWKRAARQLLFVGFLIRLSLSGVAVVRTMHNVGRPAGLRWHEHRLLDWFDALTDIVIRLNDHTPGLPRARSVTIPHGHYREWFADYPRADPVPGRFGYAGLIRRYKGVETLIESFSQLEDDPESGHVYSLRIGGKPSTADLADVVSRLSAADTRIMLELGFLADSELVDLLTSSSLVVLPYRFMHNSGTVLAALSLDRPVLVPNNEVNRDLAFEVGPEWVQLYEADLTAGDLEKAMSAVRALGGSRPDLSGRAWPVGICEHVRAYRSVVGGEPLGGKPVGVGSGG
jgi:beta-1,4-mannosyltransferase